MAYQLSARDIIGKNSAHIKPYNGYVEKC